MIAIYLLCRKDIDSLELAWLFFEHVIWKRGIPDNIVTDRGTQFTSRFRTRVCSHLSTDHRLSTAFHPQTDEQTERQNQTMEHYLRALCNNEQDNWVELLPLAVFGYNDMIHTFTRMSPFWANYHNHPAMQFKAPKQPSSLNSEIQTDTFAAGLEETHQTLRKTLQEAQATQTKYAGGKEVVFHFGDNVWLSTRHFRTTRPSKKLGYKRTGLYTVSKVIKKNAYELDLPYTILKHNVFHVSLPDCYTPPTASQPPSEPQPTVVDDSDEWEVDCILDSKRCYRQLHYLVQWAGYSYVQSSWEPAENLGNAQELVDDFNREHPRKPRRWLDSEEWDWMFFYKGFTLLTFLRILAQDKWRRHGFSPPPVTSQVAVAFPSAPNPPWGCS